MNVEPLFDDGLFVAAGMNNPWIRRSTVHLADLIHEPWILSPPGWWHHTRMEEAFRAQGLSLPKVRIVSFTVALRMQLMAVGPYISAFSGSVMRLTAQRFGIVALPVDLPRRPWPVVIVTMKNRTQSAVVERFVEAAQEVAKSFSEPVK